MNEERYKSEDLQDYRGILTSVARSGRFKMELKVEDNSVLERWAEKNKPTIELEFKYNFENSIKFVHNRNTCPNYLENKECNECERRDRIYGIFEANLEYLQLGDTFEIKAVLINNDRSTLPAEIHNFERYQPLLVACDEYRLRLTDTPAGINHKYELLQQELQREREEAAAEEQEKAAQEAAQEAARKRKRNESIQQFLGKRPYTVQIVVTAIGTALATAILNPVPHIFGWLKSIFYLFF